MSSHKWVFDMHPHNRLSGIQTSGRIRLVPLLRAAATIAIESVSSIAYAPRLLIMLCPRRASMRQAATVIREAKGGK